MLVYIHGGGYVYGNPRNWPFDHWIHQSPNVVIASVYYRLDSIGFLTVPEFQTEGLGDLNAGFLDQIQALEREYKNLELILVGTQRENERSMMELERCALFPSSMKADVD